MRVLEVAAGPYGPNNPAPPPPGRPPPNSQDGSVSNEMAGQAQPKRGRVGKDKRKQTYWAEKHVKQQQRHFKELAKNRARSRSPVRPQDRGGPVPYRARTPPRREQVQERVIAAPIQQEQPESPNVDSGVCFICDQPGHDVIDCPKKVVKCYACNEWGHTRRYCKGLAGGFGSEHLIACYRCGELGHVARECTVVASQLTMTDSYTAPVQLKDTLIDYGLYEAPERGVRSGPSSNKAYTQHEKVATWDAGDDDCSLEEEISNDRGPSHNPQYQDNSNQGWRSFEDRSGPPALGASPVDYAMEDEVDWDDDALQASDSAAPRKGPTHYRPPSDASLQYLEGELQLQKQRNVERQRHNDQQATPENWLAKSKNLHTLHPEPQKNSQHTPNMPPMSINRHRTSNSAPQLLNPDCWPSRQEVVQPQVGLPPSQGANVANTMPTAYDLRGYERCVAREMRNRPEGERVLNVDNGKVAPAMYGSGLLQDFGLCYQTFLARRRCEMGLNCPWRHHPLSNAERSWLVKYGGEKGWMFIEKVEAFWAYPGVPVPGARLHGKGGWEM